jgi:hypothetical protein
VDCVASKIKVEVVLVNHQGDEECNIRTSRLDAVTSILVVVFPPVVTSISVVYTTPTRTSWAVSQVQSPNLSFDPSTCLYTPRRLRYASLFSESILLQYVQSHKTVSSWQLPIMRIKRAFGRWKSSIWFSEYGKLGHQTSVLGTVHFLSSVSCAIPHMFVHAR